MWIFRMGEPFFMILSSIQMGSGSFSASAWKVCFREASAKNMNTFTKSRPKSLPPCVYHSSCKTYCKYMQIRYLYMMFVWNVKDKVTKSCKTHFRETSTQKTWKLLPRASATAVRCRFLIHMSKSCIAKMTTLKTETQVSLSLSTDHIGYCYGCLCPVRTFPMQKFDRILSFNSTLVFFGCAFFLFKWNYSFNQAFDFRLRKNIFLQSNMFSLF